MLRKTDTIASEKADLQLTKWKHYCIAHIVHRPDQCPLEKTNFKLLDFVVNRFSVKLFRTNKVDAVKSVRF